MFRLNRQETQYTTKFNEDLNNKYVHLIYIKNIIPDTPYMSNRSEAKLTGQFEEYRGSVYQQNLQCFISIYHAYRHLM